MRPSSDIFLLSSCLILLLVADLTLSLIGGDPQSMINGCLDTKFHKSGPGREDALHKHCKPWQDNACCTSNTTVSAHDEVNHYKLDLNHCERTSGHKMSPECTKFFTRDTCFFDCEPHIGLFAVNVTRSFGTERMYGVPLCASQCDLWWNACRNDYTCAYHWSRGLSWGKQGSTCRPGSQCKPFHETFQNAADFCEAVWDGSWKYTPDTEPCYKLWFNSRINPNKKVAQYYFNSRFGTSSSSIRISSTSLFLSLLFLSSIAFNVILS